MRSPQDDLAVGRLRGSMALLVRTEVSMLKMLRDDFEELGRHRKLKLANLSAVCNVQRVDCMRSHAALTRVKTPSPW